MDTIRKGPYLRLLAALVLIGISIFPIYWMFVTSTTSGTDLFGTHAKIWPDLSRLNIYWNAIQDGRIARWLVNSLLVAAGTTVISLALGLPMAYALSRFRFREKSALAVLLLLTQMLPESLLVVPLFSMFKDFNLLDTYYGLIMADGAFTLPIVVLILKGAIDAVPFQIDESARLDGCNTFSILWRIIAPLVAPSAAAAAIIAFFNGWNEYVFAVTFIFDLGKQPASVGLASFVGENSTPLDLVMAGGLLYTLPAVVFYMFAQKYVVSGMTTGSVKG